MTGRNKDGIVGNSDWRDERPISEAGTSGPVQMTPSPTGTGHFAPSRLTDAGSPSRRSHVASFCFGRQRDTSDDDPSSPALLSCAFQTSGFAHGLATAAIETQESEEEVEAFALPGMCNKAAQAVRNASNQIPIDLCHEVYTDNAPINFGPQDHLTMDSPALSRQNPVNLQHIPRTVSGIAVYAATAARASLSRPKEYSAIAGKTCPANNTRQKGM